VRALLGLEPQDVRPVLALGLVHAAIGAAVAAGDATVQASFVARAGSERLFLVLACNAVLSPALAFAFARVVGRRGSRATIGAACAFAILTSVGGLAVLGIADARPGWAVAAYVAHEVASTIVTIHWGVFLLSHLGGSSAMRGVPAVYAASRAGAALAGLAIGPLVGLAGTAAGLGLAGGCFAVAALLALGTRRGERTSLDSVPPGGSEEPRRAAVSAWRLMARSPLLRAIAVATAAMILTRVLLRFQQQSVLESHGERSLAGMLGLYTAAANAVGVALQLGLVGRLLARVGLTRANLLYASATVLAQVALFFAAALPAALGARFVDGELKDAIKTPLSSLFYEAFPRAERPEARAAILGVVSPTANLAGAAALALLAGLSWPWASTAAGGAICALFVLATVLQNRRYEAAIRRGSLGADQNA